MAYHRLVVLVTTSGALPIEELSPPSNLDLATLVGACCRHRGLPTTTVHGVPSVVPAGTSHLMMIIPSALEIDILTTMADIISVLRLSRSANCFACIVVPSTTTSFLHTFLGKLVDDHRPKAVVLSCSFKREIQAATASAIVDKLLQNCQGMIHL